MNQHTIIRDIETGSNVDEWEARRQHQAAEEIAGEILPPSTEQMQGWAERDRQRAAIPYTEPTVEYARSQGMSDEEAARNAVVPDYYPTPEEARDLMRLQDAEPDPAPPATDELSAVSAGDMLKDSPELRQPLIEGILRLTETANMIDAAKGGKTHTAIDLALSVATGRAWLKRFTITNPGPVLYIDAELHPNTMARRIASICSARGIFSNEIAGKLDVLSLRGRLRNIFDLRIWLADHAAAGKYRLIVFDALYRLIPEGIDENSNSDMTRVFNAVDQIGESTGAAVLVVHHASKGVQAGKSVVDVGSGASAMARATDSHLIFRQHAEDGCKVLEGAGRSWPPLEPLVLRWNYPTWDIDDTLDPEDLRETGRRKRKDETETTPEPQIKWTVEMFVETFLGESPLTESVIITKAFAAEMSERQAKRLLAAAVETGLAHRWTFSSRKIPHRFSTVEQPVTATGSGGKNV